MSTTTHASAMSEALAPFIEWIDAVEANPDIGFPDNAAFVSPTAAGNVKVSGADFRRLRAAAKTHLPELLAEYAAMREALERLIIEGQNGPNYRPSRYAWDQAQDALAGVERCPTCNGSGLALNISGEPDECPERNGNTVVPVSSDPRYPVLLADASARTEGRNLDGSERREAVAVKVEPLADFAIWAVVNAIFEGGDLDWLETQEKAEELGVIVPEIYDLEKHGLFIEAEPGDTIFVLNEHLAARRSSNEEGGR